MKMVFIFEFVIDTAVTFIRKFKKNRFRNYLLHAKIYHKK